MIHINKIKLLNHKEDFRICRLLEIASIKREVIETDYESRGIGKTTQLIKFAKHFGFAVIVTNRLIAKNLQLEHKHRKIYALADLALGFHEGQYIGTKQVVVDEGVDISKLPKEVEVITGFVYKSSNSLESEEMELLKIEVETLKRRNVQLKADLNNENRINKFLQQDLIRLQTKVDNALVRLQSNFVGKQFFSDVIEELKQR